MIPPARVPPPIITAIRTGLLYCFTTPSLLLSPSPPIFPNPWEWKTLARLPSLSDFDYKDSCWILSDPWITKFTFEIIQSYLINLINIYTIHTVIDSIQGRSETRTKQTEDITKKKKRILWLPYRVIHRKTLFLLPSLWLANPVGRAFREKYGGALNNDDGIKGTRAWKETVMGSNDDGSTINLAAKCASSGYV